MIRLTSLVFVLVIIACNNNDVKDPYEDIFTQTPFAPITDSIREAPDNDELYFRRAVLLNTNNFPEPALADFRSAWSIKKREPYALGISTILLEKKPDSAVVFLKQAVADIPGSNLLQLSLARAYDAQGKLDDAILICDEILRKNPEQVDVMKMKADLLDRKGDSKHAISLLEQAYYITPFDVELNYELALKYAEARDPKVLRLCDSLLKADTDISNLHAEPAYYKGIYYSNIGDKSKAIILFNEAISRNYYYLNAHIEKGRAYFDQKNIAEARKSFDLALTISPKFPDAYFWIAKCMEAEGKKEEAKLNYLRAFSLDPGFVEAKEAAEKIGSRQ